MWCVEFVFVAFFFDIFKQDLPGLKPRHFCLFKLFWSRFHVHYLESGFFSGVIQMHMDDVEQRGDADDVWLVGGVVTMVPSETERAGGQRRHVWRNALCMRKMPSLMSLLS